MEDIRILQPSEFPKPLLEIPQPPATLYIRGNLPPPDYVYLAVVGSRKHTSYGRDICEKLIKGLKGYPIVIVSGLALGIDAIAHTAALDAGLLTIGMPGSGLSSKVLYPRTNISLAEKIVTHGGCLISEFKPETKAELYTFPQRNRLMAGISKATLIIEAAEKSGTLITARMALDYNRDVLAVPGSVFSDVSLGTNKLIQQGAVPILDSTDLLEALGFEVKHTYQDPNHKYACCSDEEKKILELLREPVERNELIRMSGLPITHANALLSIMEIKELIRDEYGELRKI